MISLEEREEIINAFDAYSKMLTQTQRQAIQLHYLEDLSLAEIAEILATSRQAVHDAVKKGVSKLKTIKEKIG